MRIVCKGQEIENLYYVSTYRKNIVIKILSHILMLIPALGMLLASTLFFTKQEDSNRLYSLSVAWLCPWLVTTEPTEPTPPLAGLTTPLVESTSESSDQSTKLSPSQRDRIYCSINRRKRKHLSGVFIRKKSSSESKLPPRASLLKVRRRNEYIGLSMKVPETLAFDRARNRDENRGNFSLREGDARQPDSPHSWVLQRGSSLTDPLLGGSSSEIVNTSPVINVSETTIPSLAEKNPPTATSQRKTIPVVESITTIPVTPLSLFSSASRVEKEVTIKPITNKNYLKKAPTQAERNEVIKSFEGLYSALFNGDLLTPEIKYNLAKVLNEIRDYQLKEKSTPNNAVKSLSSEWELLKKKIDKCIIFMSYFKIKFDVESSGRQFSNKDLFDRVVKRKTKEEKNLMYKLPKEELEGLLSSLKEQLQELLSSSAEQVARLGPHCTVIEGEEPED